MKKPLLRALGAVLGLAIFVVPVSHAQGTLEYVGSYDPGTPGLNASAVGLEGFAYLGSWGSASNCPGLGVRSVDLREPSAPVPVGRLAAYAGTTAEHLVPARLGTSAFNGNVLFVGIQRCPNRATEGGLAAWDISDPAAPRELSYFGTGRTTRGVHEFAIGVRGDRAYAFLAVPNGEVLEGKGDLRIVDVTNPARPVEVAAWGAGRDAGLPVGGGSGCHVCRGSVAQVFLHSVALSPDARTAYLSYWDLGVVMLDVSNPAAPRYLGRYAEPMEAEGNTHSVALAHDGRLALVADETFEVPWGRLRLVDVQDPANPVQVGSYETPNNAAEVPGGSQTWFTIHNPLVDDRDPNRAYLAWYADGVRLIDVSDASAPFEVASFVPESAFTWNTALMGDYLLVGDVNGGLYVLRR